jgi:phage/plasmid-associated DNA primase
MDEELQKFIKKYHLVSPASPCTHVSLIQPHGRFMLDHKVIDKFWEIYCEKFKRSPDIVHGIAEFPQSDPKTFIPIIIDIDLKLHAEGEPRLLYTKEDVSTLVDILQTKINDIFEVGHRDLICFLLEKPPRRDSVSGDIKSGFHLHFPIFVRKQTIISELYPRVTKEMDKNGLFEDYGGSEVLDQGMPNKCPLLYGGRKAVEQKNYICTRAYNPEGEEFSTIDEALQGYKIYDNKGNLLQSNIEILPRIFSIFISGRQAHELKPDVHRREERPTVKIPDYTTDEIDRNLEEASAILPMLKRDRSDDYNDWLRVGFSLFNISGGNRQGLQLWIEFSKRTVRKDLIPENDCTTQWTKMAKGTLTIGTLLYYAKKDNPKEYAAYLDKKFGEKIQDDCEGIYYNLACYVHSMCLDEYICVLPSSNKMGSWYCWDDNIHIWKRDTQVPLERRLPGMLTEKLDLEVQKCHKELGETKQNTPEAKSLNSRMELLKKTKRDILDKRCKRTDIMKDCADMFYDTDFIGKLDRNTEIIPFNNGVFDLRSMKFRETVREDYCTKTVGYSYEELDPESKEIADVDDFLMKVYPDQNLREYAMTYFCSLLKGGNFNKTFMIFKGTGNNAKSAVVELLNQTLGPFSATLPTSFITGRRTQSSSATPEVYRNMHTRLVILQEPNKGEVLNSGIVKEITGNDRMYVRGLFEEGLEFRPQFKVLLVCLEENTKVSLSNGISLSIKNLVNNKQKILSWDSETNGLLPTTQHLLIDKGHQECIKLTLLDGRQITCTPEHKFLTNNNNWIEAKDIKINDTYLKMGIDNPSCDDIFNEYNYNIKLGKYSFDLSKLDDKLKFMAYARLVGFMLADGTRNYIVYAGHIIDGNNILNDIKLLTGKTPSLTKNRRVFQTHFPSELRDSICSFLDIQYGGRINNKMQLPSFIFDDDCPTFIIREFIAGMFGGDGIIPPIHENRFGTLSLIASKIDAHVDSLINSFDELSELLLSRFGISSYISTIPYKDENKQYVYLNISKRSSILKFCENIGFRYCCHKSHRCVAIESYSKYRNYVIEYNKKIIIRTKELFDEYNRQNPKPKILQLDKNTGEIINTYNSTQDVQNKLGIRHGNVRSAIERGGSSGGFLWKEKVENTEILNELGCKTLKLAILTAIEETIAKNGIIDKEHIITYSQVRRYIHDNIEYKSPISTDIRKYMKQCDLEQFCNDGSKKIKYSVSRDRLTLPCYQLPVIHIENVGIKHVYDINVDEPYSNFIAEGIVTHNCNEEPMVPSEDFAFWKRARVLPHESVFDEIYPETQDEQFEKKRFPIDRRFWEKIPRMVQAFMWKLIRKYEETKGGVIKIEPQKVLSATSRYRRANDKYKSFTEEVMIYEKGKCVTVSEAYSRYKEWLREGFPGSRCPDKNHFQEQMSRYIGNDPTRKGCWQDHQMRETDEPVDEKDSNGLNQFMEECTEESTSNTPLKDMYNAYLKWVAKKGIEAGEEAALKSKLEIINQMVVLRILKGEERIEYNSNSSNNSNSSSGSPPSPLNCLNGAFKVSNPPFIIGGDSKLRTKMKDEMKVMEDNESEGDDTDSSDETEEE